MSNRNLLQQSVLSVLATDLDGTFLPLNGLETHVQAMKKLGSHFTQESRQLVFVTGRHYTSVRAVMSEVGSPKPAYIICDVGTSIYGPGSGEADYEVLGAYRDHLNELTERLPLRDFAMLIRRIDGLRKQEPEKQGTHKLSFYCAANRVEGLVDELESFIVEKNAPYSVIGSVDPFNGDGLIDVLPVGVNKAYALEWLGQQVGFSQGETIFSGDSGNDLAALTSGYNAILVGNATDALKVLVRQRMAERNQGEKLYISDADSTSGIVEGCLYFGVRFGLDD